MERKKICLFTSVLRVRIRIRRIHKFLGLPDPDLLVRDTDPDPSYHQAKIVPQGKH
jgi:hypothetical protein